ncbi:MAG: type 1 glutamine amidotransferase [Haloferacaceae archaeon]
MTRIRLALLNAAHDGANTRRNFRRELDADLVEYDVTGGELPGGAGESTFDFDGVVVTGSRSSVYWDEAWIPPLLEYVREAHEHGLPILGVCYGHQVVAEALGGRVTGMDDFELGYSEIRRRTEDDPVLAGIGTRFTAFTSHGDVVVDPPPGARVLAENEYGIHAFRKGHAWGVQFHPEYDVETAREVADGKRDRLGDDRVDAVLAGITPERHAEVQEVKRLFDNFLAAVEEARTAPA